MVVRHWQPYLNDLASYATDTREKTHGGQERLLRRCIFLNALHAWGCGGKWTAYMQVGTLVIDRGLRCGPMVSAQILV